MIARGSQVFDVADRRHVGTVKSIFWIDAVRRVGLASVRWNETLWLSVVPVRDLRLAEREPAAPRITLSMRLRCLRERVR